MGVAQTVQREVGDWQFLHQFGERFADEVGVERCAERCREYVTVFLPSASDELA